MTEEQKPTPTPIRMHGFSVKILCHREPMWENLTPEGVQHIIGAAFEARGLDFQEEVDFTLEVARTYE